MKNVLKKLFSLITLPFLMIWRAIKWPSILFKKKEPEPEPSVIERIAALTPEGEPFKPEPKRSYGSYSTPFWNQEQRAKYKEANKGTIWVRSWSFDPGSINYMRKVMNRWRWRMGMYNQLEADSREKAQDSFK